MTNQFTPEDRELHNNILQVRSVPAFLATVWWHRAKQAVRGREGTRQREIVDKITRRISRAHRIANGIRATINQGARNMLNSGEIPSSQGQLAVVTNQEAPTVANRPTTNRVRAHSA